jgi:hypothetical protein
MKKILLASLALLTTPAQAQYYPQYQSWCFDWSCQQPQQKRSETRHHSRHTERRHTEKPVVHHTEKPKPEVRTRVVTVTRPAVVHPAATWRSMNQDEAREWIKEQAQSFCGRYPKDEACVKKE